MHESASPLWPAPPKSISRERRLSSTVLELSLFPWQFPTVYNGLPCVLYRFVLYHLVGSSWDVTEHELLPARGSIECIIVSHELVDMAG